MKDNYFYANYFGCGSMSENNSGTQVAHLSALQQAGLVAPVKVGQWIYYSLNEQTIRNLSITAKANFNLLSLNQFY